MSAKINPDFYKSQGRITDPGKFKQLFDSLPANVSEIVEIVQGLFLHIFWAERYGVELTESQKTEVQSRYVENILETILSKNATSLTVKRSYADRFIGNCRDFSVFLTAILRSKGIPARARCGFARYFIPGKFEDHWICEYWSQAEQRWIGVDAQLDEFQQDVLQIDFDPLDVPTDQFISGPAAWKLCRTGQENPNDFGIMDMYGLWFVRGDFVRDVAALNKIELLPWDCWGLINGSDDEMTEDALALLDQVADLMLTDDQEVVELYHREDRLKIPKVFMSFVNGTPTEVTFS